MISADDMRNILRHRCEEAGSQREWSRLNDAAETTVSAILAGRMPVTRYIAGKLGYQRFNAFKPLHQTNDVK